ncbi:MAG: NADP-dependent isocitrate dehydrogenase, partial [Treponema sp.]|nr:NADP-dependent isocitrate dehydrogenase [Treponema sp.]
KRAELDHTPELAAFAKKLEAASLRTVEEGDMTGDLVKLASPAPAKSLDSGEFIEAILKRLDV